MSKNQKVFVLRAQSGEFLIGYEGGAYIVGKKREAKHFKTVENAVKGKPLFGNWEVVEYKKRITNGESNVV